jgi:hypothetical protein
MAGYQRKRYTLNLLILHNDFTQVLFSACQLLKTVGDPIAMVMQRLLTGHAVGISGVIGRQGALFQNSYKLILCQEDAYQLELGRQLKKIIDHDS